jgi:hypothetical protein
MPDGELVDPVMPAFFDVAFSLLPLLLVVPFLILFVGALVSIRRRSAAMTGLEELGWYAFVVFAQVIGPAVWFLFARERYEWAAAPPHWRNSGG